MISRAQDRDDLFVYGRDSALARKHFQGLQRGVCRICERSANLYVDHEHSEKGLVRGLLCSSCNTALGHVGDSAERLERCIGYLAEHEARNAAYEESDDWRARKVTVVSPPAPSLDSAARLQRDNTIREEYSDGAEIPELARRYALSVKRVYAIVLGTPVAWGSEDRAREWEER